MSDRPREWGARTSAVPGEWTSLVALLRDRAASQGDDPAFVFLKDGEVEEAALSYGELDHRARSIAACLQQQAAAGDRALLLFPPGLDYICAFFGCLYAGVIAVPIYPPQSQRSRADRLQSVVADSGAGWLLGTTEIVNGLTQEVELLGRLRTLTTDSVDDALAQAWQMPAVDAGTIAFLQYTSGSTGQAKGVMVSHGNLLHNEALIRDGFGTDRETVVVGWLPLYHDMGLVGNVLQPIYLGGRAVLMSPMAFLQKPLRWLQAVSRYRATVSGGPNFAYELCAERIGEDDMAELDLSCWRVAFNGSEPIRATTLERFAQAFAPCGFRADASFACYGLAESTLFVAGSTPLTPTVCLDVDPAQLQRHRVMRSQASDRRRLVGSGHAEPTRVCIVQPESRRPCAMGEVGEIWVRGPSVAQGYWRQPELSADTFDARTDAGDGPFLRTGDFGFVQDGQLFVTGRLKELIIIRGRNHYPQDIEQTVQAAHPALAVGAGAAFAIDQDGEERLVVVQEVQRTHLRQLDVAAVEHAVRAAVAERHQLQLHALVLIKPMRLPKTSSGKIKRRETRRLFVERLLETLNAPAERTAKVAESAAAYGTPLDRHVLANLPSHERVPRIADHLRALLSEVLRRPAADIDVNLAATAQGLDSLAAIQLQQRIEETLAASCPLESLLVGTTPIELARMLDAADDGAMPARLPCGGLDEGPLTANQTSMWFLQSLDPTSRAYNIAVPLRLRGPLNAACAQQAWALLAARHPMLRTRYVVVDGEPVQRIDAGHVPVIEWVDATGWNNATIERALAAAAGEALLQDEGVPFRIHGYRRAADDHIVMVVAHHIAVDLRTLVLLFDQWGQQYAALCGAREPIHADARHSAIDLALWQRDWFASQAAERQWSYWRNQLEAPLPVLGLLTDQPRPALRNSRAGVHDFELDAPLSAALRDVARQHGVTLYVLLLAAYQVLLHHSCGDDDICVGSPVAGRTRAEFESLAGYCVNTVVLRGDLSGNPRFDTFLWQIRDRVLGALAHQDLPFATLVERLTPQRDPAITPLFQTLFALQQTPDWPAASAFVLGGAGARAEMGGLAVEGVAMPPQGCQFDLSLFVVDAGDRLQARLEYASALFSPARIAAMGEQFAHLLQAIVSAPTARLSGLPLLSAQPAAAVSGPVLEAAADQAVGLAEQIVRQAGQHPDTLALICDGERLSYARLEREAVELAGRLQAQGVCLGARVGLHLARTTHAYVAVLAVLKCGATCVPLDPAYPPARLAQIAQLGCLTLLVSDAMESAAVWPVDLPCFDPRCGSSSGPFLPPSPATLAASELPVYLLFTSGSTGTPKGVLMNQGALANLLRWHQHAMPLEPGARVSQFASLNFDVAFQEILSTWTAGATLVVASQEQRLDPEALLVLLREEGVQRAFLPVVAMQQLARHAVAHAAMPAALREVVCAGEALQIGPSVRAFFAALPGASLYNHYGPTESHVVTCHRLDGDPSGWPAMPPIGTPIDNVCLHLLDRYGRPVPEGARGEIFLAGAGLAHGYAERGGLTAERFVPDPFAGGGARMYRTGDLGRRLADGAVEYLGRIDSQVQLRGFRVEPGEIESQLLALESVGEAVVVVYEARPGEPSLVAYVVAADGHLLEPSQLRAWLRDRLPDYMVPAYIVALPVLPLTANGKVDKRALPIPEANPQEDADDPPVGATEIEVARLWADVLGVRPVGRTQNFFASGGHSLLATRLVMRLREAFGATLPISALFEAPTVAGLAARIDALPAAGLPPLEAVARGKPLPLSHAQQRLWLVDQMEGASAAYNMPAAFHLDGALDVLALRASFQRIVQRHEILRTRFADHQGEPMQWIADNCRVTLETDDVGPDAIDTAIEQHAQTPFRLQDGGLLRVALLRIARDRHLLLVNMHHIVADGWSIGVLVRELMECYAAERDGREPVLPDLPVQYADYAQWQRAWLKRTAATQLAYWRVQLDGLPPLLELPADRPRPPVQSYRGGLHRFRLPDALAGRIQAFSQSHGATLFMTLMAAYQVLLARHSGQTDIAVGTPVANRDRAELEHLIGFFVNTVVVRGRLDSAASFIDVLHQVRDTTVDAQRNQDLPFEQLVEELRPARSLSHAPLFQVMFLQHDGALADFALPGLGVRAAGEGHRIARFDLALNVESRADGLHAWFDYASDLFDAARVERLAGDYVRLLEAAMARPDQPWRRLPMLDDAAIADQLRSQLALPPPVDPALCVHQLFERKVDENPQAPAAICGEASVTYGALDARANRIAHYLRGQGVGAEDHVGVWMERSPDLLACLLGIWKAGAVYVPLDPGYPHERLAFIVRDAGMRLVLTHAQIADALESPGGRIVCLDRLGAELDSQPNERLTVHTHGLQPAYVIYTSGSTGRPKGVQVLQGGLCELLLGLCRRFSVGPGDSMPSLASHAFGISFVELLLPLVAGGHSRILEREVVLDTGRLAAELDRVSLAHLVPSLMRRVLDHLTGERQAPVFGGLRHVFVGGDAVPAALLAQMEQRFPSAQVVEFYGQTETTILSCHAPQGGHRHPGNVIGTRLPHAQAYVLDDGLQLVPQGRVGEIHIAGRAIARGYLGRPSLSAERFVPDPFGETPGARLYRTGDLGRLLVDGNIEYVGRADFQVNIRGFRIELGEIEAQLREEPGVTGAVVTAVEDDAGERRLIAYLVAAADKVSIPALRARLRAALPDYMVPARFVVLDALPLNANGKLDRKALPDPDLTQAAADYVAPRDDTEQVLADMWADVLGVPQVGVHDNFFDLGGHSLLAAQAMARARGAFGEELSVQDFFEAQTVADFAARIAAIRRNRALLEQVTADAEESPDEFEGFVI